MEPTPRPICWSCWLLIRLAEWRAVTCPISWPMTPASSASEFRAAMIPLVIKMNPPGSAKAFTMGSSTSLNDQGNAGRSDREAISCPRFLTMA